MNSQALVSKFLKKYRLRTESCDQVSVSGEKCPSFKAYLAQKPQLYCEIKNIEHDPWHDSKSHRNEMSKLVGGLKDDPVFNRLTAHIHRARKQFDAVNSNEEMPNVLVLHNQNKNSGFLDFLTIVTGNYVNEEGTRVFPIYKPLEEGRVFHEIRKIHLFIWIDDHQSHRFLLNTANSRHQSKLSTLFGFETDNSELSYLLKSDQAPQMWEALVAPKKRTDFDTTRYS